ncbi:MAG: hypothetical protein Q7U97_03525 [Rhodocyclaceae bacterium]|nr:hypothetical protein [Rhodocyclaceae bacterium]
MIPGGSSSLLLAGVTPGTVTYDIAGSNNFTVPDFNTLVVEMWGPGGGSGGAGPSVGNNGTDGTATTFNGLSAGGGLHGNGQAGTGQGASGNGGTASGGDINTNGIAGTTTSTTSTGHGAPVDGGGDVTSDHTAGPGGQGGKPGTTPGGGASGAAWNGASFPVAGASGTGAYVKKTYVTGQLNVGSIIAAIVGTQGVGGYGNALSGNTGGPGKIVITWS